MQQMMISSLELAELLNVPVRQASKVIHEVNRELEEKGIYVFKTKVPRAPRKEVLRKVGVYE